MNILSTLKTTAKDIELELATRYFNKLRDLIIPNASWGFHGFHECDLLVCTKAGYLIEVEIKVSKADLIKDSEKKHRHNLNAVKEFYFAIPEKLKVCIDLIPKYAGIIVIPDLTINDHPSEYNSYSKFIRYKPYLLRESNINNPNPMKISINDKFKLARLGTLRMWNLKKKLNSMKFN